VVKIIWNLELYDDKNHNHYKEGDFLYKLSYYDGGHVITLENVTITDICHDEMLETEDITIETSEGDKITIDIDDIKSID
jgi:hypothetical protein